MENTTPTRSPIWSWLFAILAVVRLADFAWYGHNVRDFIAGIGFFLMAFASFRNAPTNLKNASPNNSYLYWLSIAGLALVLISIVLRYTLKT